MTLAPFAVVNLLTYSLRVQGAKPQATAPETSDRGNFLTPSDGDHLEPGLRMLLDTAKWPNRGVSRDFFGGTGAGDDEPGI